MLSFFFKVRTGLGRLLVSGWRGAPEASWAGGATDEETWAEPEESSSRKASVGAGLCCNPGIAAGIGLKGGPEGDDDREHSRGGDGLSKG